MGEDQGAAAYFNTCVCSLGCGGLGMRATAFSSSFNCHYQNKNKQKSTPAIKFSTTLSPTTLQV